MHIDWRPKRSRRASRRRARIRHRANDKLEGVPNSTSTRRALSRKMIRTELRGDWRGPCKDTTVRRMLLRESVLEMPTTKQGGSDSQDSEEIG